MNDVNPLDTAWRIHAAVTDWTGKVDSKASFTLTIESALLAGIVTLSASNRRFGGLAGFWDYLFYWLGVSLLVLAVITAAWVVRPRLRRRHLQAEAKDNFIYFGHLRHWERSELTQALRERDPLPMLSAQLVNMSKIAWQKHMLVRYSLTAALLGTVSVSVAAFLAG